MATEKILIDEKAVHEHSPGEIRMTWNTKNLTSTENVPIRISLWGYRETTSRTELLYIDTIEVLYITLYPLQLMKAAVPAESYVIHLSSASLFSCDVYGQ